MSRSIHFLGLLGLLLLLIGSGMGLFYSPPERHMGDVSRILYAHVPIAWNTLLIMTFAFGFAVLSLWTGDRKHDARMVGAIETGIALGLILLPTGMIWARPTWGIWWDWDVRLTTTLIGVLLYAGVLALRAFLSDPAQRATWSAVAVIVAWVDIPLIYFCVRWWRSLHQLQSSPDTVSSSMVGPLRINAFAVLFIAIWCIAMRAMLERRRMAAEETAPPARVQATVADGDAQPA